MDYQKKCELKLILPSDRATMAFGHRLGQLVVSSCLIFLRGQLGVGKTTLSRGFLRAKGYKGTVKSPTYTLVEPYEFLSGLPVYHIDLYRLTDGAELSFLGIGEYLESGILLIEWPDRAEGYLPSPDLEIRLAPKDLGREASILANDKTLLTGLCDDYEVQKELL